MVRFNQEMIFLNKISYLVVLKMIRPQFLFPLFGSLENLKGIGSKTVLNLKKNWNF